MIPFSAVASAASASSGLTKLTIQTIVAQASKTMANTSANDAAGQIDQRVLEPPTA